MKRFIVFIAILSILGLPATSMAITFTGGDATSQAAADDILDMVFVFDTSGSMSDEISSVYNNMQTVIDNLDCPECNVWVRATIMGITADSLFGENVVSYVNNAGGSPVSNQSEDNAPAVLDMVNYFNWNDDSTADQDYYKAIVTVGDEGTENGYPVEEDDWAAAYAANQAAISDEVMVFSLIGTVYPSAGYEADEANRNAVFSALAIGGSSYGYNLGNTGGTVTYTTSTTIETDIENIICTAGGGGNTTVPEPATIILLGTGLLGLVGASRKKFKR